ncbi:MAG: hypothetical protein INF92_03100 [Rhodobacter sp.]|nr:hypothetical protein [Rhodobacter sp.]
MKTNPLSSPAGKVVPDDKPVMEITREERPMTVMSSSADFLTVWVKQAAMVTSRNVAAPS